MKRMSVILFCLLLVWMQAIVAGPGASAGTECACCDCGKAECCTARPSPGSVPAPATPVRASIQNELPIFASTSVAWTLPNIEQQISLPSDLSPMIAASVPLFARHCALLL